MLKQATATIKSSNGHIPVRFWWVQLQTDEELTWAVALVNMFEVKMFGRCPALDAILYAAAGSLNDVIMSDGRTAVSGEHAEWV